MALFNTLEKLISADSVSGFEGGIREVMKKELKPFVDEIKVDKIGNLIARKGKGKPKVMITAHMDEIGLMVKDIEKDGFIRFDTVGGWDNRILLASKVKIYGSKGGIIGVVGSKPIHVMEEEEKKKPIKLKDLFIDIGAKSDKEVNKAGVEIGNFVAPYGELNKLISSRITGQGFDDKLGCLALIEIMKSLKNFKGTVYIAGTVQEETGLIGIRGTAFGVEPDVVLAIDTTIAGDTPEMKGESLPTEVGKGPVLVLKDAISMMQPQVKKWMKAAAKKAKLNLQYEVMMGGATDASITPTVREGIPSGCVAIASRYIHTPVEVADMKDIESVVKLVVEAVKMSSQYI